MFSVEIRISISNMSEGSFDSDVPLSQLVSRADDKQSEVVTLVGDQLLGMAESGSALSEEVNREIKGEFLTTDVDDFGDLQGTHALFEVGTNGPVIVNNLSSPLNKNVIRSAGVPDLSQIMLAIQ